MVNATLVNDCPAAMQGMGEPICIHGLRNEYGSISNGEPVFINCDVDGAEKLISGLQKIVDFLKSKKGT